MPRQLPWKVGIGATKQSSSRPKAAAASPAPSASRSPAPSHRPAPAPKPGATPDTARTARRSLGLSLARSPSTSPAPEPLKEELMIEGIDHDDQYRMVEDEFLAVAGEFTRHLHTAEYQRLKGLAKSQNADTIQNISRPVTGGMTDLVKRRHAALDTASKQRKGIAKTLGKRAAGNESDGEEPSRRPATSLQGLMNSPRKQTVPLTSVAGSRPGSSYRGAADTSPSRQRPSGHGTRMVRNHSIDMPAPADGAPSARFKPEPTLDSDDDDDDDLDGQPPWPRKPALPRPEKTVKPPIQRLSALKAPSRTISEPTSSDAGNPFTRAGTTRLQTSAQETSVEQVAADDDDEDDFFSRLRARRAEQKRRRETKAQDNNTKTSDTSAINSIPFM
ncbi:hypothetical protein C8A01DRAFT_39498 [Parachaetomium inaequale]|uniref:Uncharacterized protein n=1 Tax=Parachaetomium inaequale TaxID=2588326 RepID=A0AAN6SND3_9PEZI|nr:hypothetical protein C8A01DRAFT_39498 [Parachaetomium inaequale]